MAYLAFKQPLPPDHLIGLSLNELMLSDSKEQKGEAATNDRRIDECFDLYEDEYNREWDSMGSDDDQIAEEVRRKGAFIMGNMVMVVIT